MRKCGCHSHNGLLLSPEGLAERDDVSQGVDNMDLFGYLDKSGSVSALVEVEGSHVWEDEVIEEQYRRFLSG